MKDAVWNQKVYVLGNRYIKKEFDVSFITSCAENITLERSGNTMAEPRLDGGFHVSETCRGIDYILGRVARLDGSGEIMRA